MFLKWRAPAESTDEPAHAGAAADDFSGRGGADEGRPHSDASQPSGKWKPDYLYSRYDSSVGEDGRSPSKLQERGGPSRVRGRSRYRHRIDKEQFESMTISYKNPDVLRRFTTDTGTILPRRITGVSAKGQRRVTCEIKRARF